MAAARKDSNIDVAPVWAGADVGLISLNQLYRACRRYCEAFCSAISIEHVREWESRAVFRHDSSQP